MTRAEILCGAAGAVAVDLVLLLAWLLGLPGDVAFGLGFAGSTFGFILAGIAGPEVLSGWAVGSGLADAGPAADPNPLGVTAVAYRRLKTFGHFENEAVEATAAVRPGDDPARVHADLVAWVNGRLSLSVNAADLRAESDRLSAEVEYKQREVLRLEERYRRAQEFLRESKIDPHGDVPF